MIYLGVLGVLVRILNEILLFLKNFNSVRKRNRESFCFLKSSI